MSLLPVVFSAFWAMLPAYVPNNVAVLAGGGRPIDAGLTWNGRRLLGNGKTWRGTAAGTVAGVVLASLLNVVRNDVERRVGADLPSFTSRAAVSLAAGAMLGDVAASFLKRRTGRERGSLVPGLDQLDFVAGALGLASVLAPNWFDRTFGAPHLAAVVVVTPLLHVSTNALAYVFGLKGEPW